MIWLSGDYVQLCTILALLVLHVLVQAVITEYHGVGGI